MYDELANMFIILSNTQINSVTRIQILYKAICFYIVVICITYASFYSSYSYSSFSK